MRLSAQASPAFRSAPCSSCQCPQAVSARTCYGINLANGHAGRHGRGCRYHRRTVHRRAGYPAYHAYLPYRRCRRRRILRRVFRVLRSCSRPASRRRLATLAEIGGVVAIEESKRTTVKTVNIANTADRRDAVPTSCRSSAGIKRNATVRRSRKGDPADRGLAQPA